ncbi:MAG: MFS transporter [Hydrotalea sp.]|nr:MFS transporter [Hydrotalea sp.]
MTSRSKPAPNRLLTAMTLYSKPKFLILLVLGFSSGLPLLLTSSILAYWLRKLGISVQTIGLLSLVAVPYSLKFFWSPLLDKTYLPWFAKKLGQRRAMALLMQCCLIISIAALGFADPINHIGWVVGLATLVAFFSASQDMMIDAIRVEMVKDREQAAGAAVATTGYRLAMLFIGGGIPILSDSLASSANANQTMLWSTIFVIVAGFQCFGVLAVLACPKLGEVPRRKTYKSSAAMMGDYLTERFWYPLKDFFTRQPKAITLLLFLIFYKYGDAFMGIMANPFYIDMGFTGVEIGTIVKSFGMVMTVVGGLLGGVVVFRYGFMSALWVGGLAQASANIFYIFLSLKGHDVNWLTATIAADNFAGGLATAALVGFIGHLVNVKHSVTQLALLTSFSAIGRNMLSAPAGFAVVALGYPWFFTLSIILALPGLWLLRQLHAVPAFMHLGQKK